MKSSGHGSKRILFQACMIPSGTMVNHLNMKKVFSAIVKSLWSGCLDFGSYGFVQVIFENIQFYQGARRIQGFR